MKAGRGLSLVETILALGLVSLVLILVIDLFPSAMATVRHSEQRTLADNLARSILEQQASQPFTSLTPGTGQDLQAQQLEGVSYSPRLEIFSYPNTDPARLVGLRVTVQWTYRSQTRSLVRELLIHHLPQ